MPPKRSSAVGSSDMSYLSLGPDRFFLTGPDGLPITKPPYGRMTAIDLNTGDHKWTVPLVRVPGNTFG